VPHSGGRVQLPELRLGWWNVTTATREASSVPIRTFNVAGDSGPVGFARSADRSGSGDWRVFWMPLVAILLLFTGYWGGAWLRGRRPSGERVPLRPRLQAALVQARDLAGEALATTARWLDPAPLLRGAGNLIARLTPKGTQVYRAARVADSADTPAAWCLAFQNYTSRNLQTQAREPLPRMADRIVNLRPGADRERVLKLMQQLDSALYNRHDIDFKRWKQEFRHALRPGIGGLRSLVAGHLRRGRLPELNPRPAG
jgi:hypothetical protein